MKIYNRFSLSLIIVTATAISISFASEKISFIFNPPNGINYTQIMESSKTLEYQTGQSQTDKSRAEISIKTAKTESGFSMTATPVAMSMSRDGQPIDNPMFNVLNNLVVSYDIDKSGQLVSVAGYDNFMKEIETTMSPEMVEGLKSVLNKEIMNAREVAEWNGRVGYFAGKDVAIGDKWVDTTNFQLPTGEILVFYTITSFEELVDCNGKNCLMIKFTYNSNAKELSELSGIAIKAVEGTVSDSLADNERQLPLLFGEGYRIVDPSTMLIYDEYTNRTTKIFVMTQGVEPMVVTIYEEKDYDYAY